ncbi:MAG: aminotransferase class I/II-fold pyridoxal phosphate-dependent enzyme, partial [Muribaculaceae bacterium]|nr:aminotransferase class I/II-fold pyridoxal phosphate-dependent enzyme [Muribaculaceae bacterium]
MKEYPFLDLKAVNAPVMADLEQAALRVIRSGRYIGGSEVDDFENRLAAMTGTRCAVGVSNGLDALRLIFKAYIEMGRLSKGDKVLVPANTYIASVLAVTDAGLEPVFVDASAETMNMDTSLIEQAISSGVRSILTVHLYGRPCFDCAM